MNGTTSPNGTIEEVYTDAADIKHTIKTSPFGDTEDEYTDADGNQHTIVKEQDGEENHFYTDKANMEHMIHNVPNFGSVDIRHPQKDTENTHLSVDNGKTFYTVEESQSKESMVISVDWNNDGTFADFLEFNKDGSKVLKMPPAEIERTPTPKVEPPTGTGAGKIGPKAVAQPKKTSYMTGFMYAAIAAAGALGVYKLYRWWKKRQKEKLETGSDTPEHIDYFGDTVPTSSK